MRVFLFIFPIVNCISQYFYNKNIVNNFVKLKPSNTVNNHTIIITIKQNNIDVLKKMLNDRGNLHNINYQKWLSFDQIGELIQNKNGTKEVSDWLKNNNISITNITKYGEYIKITSSIHKLNKLLNMSLYEWSNKKNIIHRSENYTIPIHLNKYIDEKTATERTNILYYYSNIITEMDDTFIEKMLEINGLKSCYVLNNPKYKYALSSESLEALYRAMINWILNNKNKYNLKEKGLPHRLHYVTNPPFEVIDYYLIKLYT